MMVRIGTILFASDTSAEGVSDAREYLRRYRLTQDDVKLAKRGETTIIEAKRGFDLDE